MNKKHGKKITLVILVSFILVLSSSLLFLDQPQSSGNSGVLSSSFVTGSYNVSFTESGLTSGTQWNVTLNGVSETSTTNSIVFAIANGSYTYTIGNVSGFSTTSYTGSGTVSGSAVPITVTFTKLAPVSISPVNLGTAGNYAILAKTGISNTGTTSIVGNIGVSPASSTYITGFSLILNSTGQFATSSLITGKVYAATYASPTPSTLTTAVGDMQTAYTDAAGRVNPNYVNLGAGNINGMTLVPGLYKWGTGVSISTSITLTGNSSSVWIFQISGGLTFGNGAHIILSGGAQPQNIFWQVASGVSIGTGASFYGIILSQTAITIATGSTMTGIALAQTAVTLQSDEITAPSGTQNITTAIYGVTFTELGLPSGTQWNVTLNDVLLSSTVPTLSFSEPNGTYAFTVASSSTDKIFPSTGNIVVNGQPVYQGITFAAPNQATYTVAFNEKGLPSGAQWGVTLNGITTTSFSSTVNFIVTNSTYIFAVIAPVDYSAAPSTGSETVSGSGIGVPITLTLVVYSTTFTETGLPSGTTWYVNGTSQSGYEISPTNITFMLTNGTHTFTVTNLTSYYATTTHFTVIIHGNKVTEKVHFLHWAYITGTISPRNAILTINGKTVSVSSSDHFNLSVIGGTYDLAASENGYTTFYSNFTLNNGNVKNLAIDLKQVSTTSTNLRINVSPANANVTVNGMYLHFISGSGTISLAPGSYYVSISSSGYVPELIEVQITEDKMNYLNVTLTASTTPTYTISGFVSPDNASVMFNGYSATVSASGYYNISLPGGSYTVSVTETGYYSFTKTITLSRNMHDLNFNLTKEPAPTSTKTISDVTASGYNVTISHMASGNGSISLNYTATTNGTITIVLPYSHMKNVTINNLLNSRLYIKGTQYKDFTVAISSSDGSYTVILTVHNLTGDPTLVWLYSPTATLPSKPSSISNVDIYAIVGVVAAIVVIAGVVMVMRKKK